MDQPTSGTLMSLDVFLLVLLSAFVQASWNFLTKRSSSNRTVLMLLGWLAAGGTFCCLGFFFCDLSQASTAWIPSLAVACVVHTSYVAMLGWGYSKGDISVVYPVSRGIGIAGTALVASYMTANTISLQGALGISAIVGGTFLIGLREGMRRETRVAFFIALAIGCCVMSYSTIDSYNVKLVPPLFYLGVINFVPALFAAPFLFTKYRRDVVAIVKGHKFECLYVAFGGAGAYLLILLAFQKSQVAYVVALREFSVVIATALGVVFLKEQVYHRKIIAVGMIVLGVVIIKLA
jgi:drug/metabolite transporter (DMT)-like permease